MATYQQQKQQVLGLLQAAAGVAQLQKKAEIVKRLQQSAQYLEKGQLMVVVCGEFKQGKSSLINAILNEPGLFPVDVDIATSLVSVIAYGGQEKITVILGEQDKRKSKTIQRSEIRDYVTEQGNRGNFREASMLMMESPNPQLKEGLVLVDTPGVGGLNTKHTGISYSFIPNADAVLFVSDAFKPMTTEELKFLKNQVAPHCRRILFVLTKIDMASDYQRVLESNRQKLSEALERPGEQINIIPVSSRARLDYSRSRDLEDLADSNFTQLESELWKLLREQRGQVLLLRPVEEIGKSLAEVKAPLQAEWETYQQHSREELDAFEKRFRDARERLDNLLDQSANWRSQLSYGLSDLRNLVTGQFQEGFLQIRRRSNDYLQDARLLQNPEQIIGMVEMEMDSLMVQIGKDLGQRAADLQQRIESSTGMDLNPFQMGALEFIAPKPTLEIRPPSNTNVWDKTLQVVRTGNFGSSGGATILGLVGKVVGGVIGWFAGFTESGAKIGEKIGDYLGNIAGMASGVKQGLQTVENTELAAIRSQVSVAVNRFVEDSQLMGQQSLLKTVTGLERSMSDDLVEQVKRQQKALKSTLDSIADARKLTQEQVARRSSELAKSLQQVEQLQKATEQMARVLVGEVPEAEARKPAADRPPSASTAEPSASTVRTPSPSPAGSASRTAGYASGPAAAPAQPDRAVSAPIALPVPEAAPGTASSPVEEERSAAGVSPLQEKAPGANDMTRAGESRPAADTAAEEELEDLSFADA